MSPKAFYFKHNKNVEKIIKINNNLYKSKYVKNIKTTKFIPKMFPSRQQVKLNNGYNYFTKNSES